MAPRFLGYLLKGARNGMLRQTFRALPAAVRLSASLAVRALPPDAKAYIRTNDGSHRGSLLNRMRREVMALMPLQPL
jgi:hypothetical protein